MARKAKPVPVTRPTFQDSVRSYHAAIRAAVDDAFTRMCEEARAGRSCDWRVYVKPANSEHVPAPIYIGAKAPGPEYMRVKRLYVDSSLECNQMFNRLRDGMCDVPVFATSFRDSVGALTPMASLSLEMDT